MWTPELQQTINVNYSKPAAPVALVHQVQYERLLQPRCVTTPPDGAKHLTKQFAAVPAHTQRLLNVLPVAGHTYTQQQQPLLYNVGVGRGSISSNSSLQLFLLTRSVCSTSCRLLGTPAAGGSSSSSKSLFAVGFQDM
jgi:hypothetical protein